MQLVTSLSNASHECPNKEKVKLKAINAPLRSRLNFEPSVVSFWCSPTERPELEPDVADVPVAFDDTSVSINLAARLRRPSSFRRRLRYSLANVVTNVLPPPPLPTTLPPLPPLPLPPPLLLARGTDDTSPKALAVVLPSSKKVNELPPLLLLPYPLFDPPVPLLADSRVSDVSDSAFVRTTTPGSRPAK